MKDIIDWYGKDFTVGVGTDHGGFELKKMLIAKLADKGIECEDFGPYEFDPQDDYSDFAGKLGRAVSTNELACGILICRSGVGMGINANRFPGVRAVIAPSAKVAQGSRDHNCSNVLVLPGDYISDDEAWGIVEAWLDRPFSNDERHIRRLLKIEENSFDEIKPIREADPEIATLLDQESGRQTEFIELIASENYASPAVRATQGTVLVNKYAEGYPNERLYHGCEYVDKIEKLAIKRALDLFGAECANVQPHSGTQANMAAYFALLHPGDSVLAMDLSAGALHGHGHPVDINGKLFVFSTYGVDPVTELIDYDQVEKKAMEMRPKLLVAGDSTYPRLIDYSKMREIADRVGAKLMVDMGHVAGLVAAGSHPSPVPFADIITAGTQKTLRGPRSGLILCKKEYSEAVDKFLFPGLQGGPMMHTIAAKAVCFAEASTAEFKDYQDAVVANASKLASELSERGLRLVTGGTDTHLLLLDLRDLKITGRQAASAFEKAGLIVNKTLIPGDNEEAYVTSGVRLGTPAVTTRGMGLAEMVSVAEWIARALHDHTDDAVLSGIFEEIKVFTKNYPLP